jgi:hypothetical protein
MRSCLNLAKTFFIRHMTTLIYPSQCLEASEFGKVAVRQLCTVTE